MDFFGGFNATKLKPQLKMAVSRFQIAANKKSAILKQQMREVAVMLAEDNPKEEKARIKAEGLIREDNAIEAYEILQLTCDLLAERIKLIACEKECPADLVSSISTLMWASHRVDIAELSYIKKQFRAKFGKKFEENAMNNVGGILNERVVSKLSVQPPAAYLIQVYLEKICEQFEVDWKPKHPVAPDEMAQPMAAPVGYSIPVANGTGLGGDTHSVSTGLDSRDSRDDNDNPPKNNNSGGFFGGGGSSGGGGTAIAARSMAEPPKAPTATAIAEPVIPVAPYAPPAQQKGKKDFEEVDIYVPAIPSAPSSSKEEKSNPPPASSASGDGSDDYNELAARFNNLKK